MTKCKPYQDPYDFEAEERVKEALCTSGKCYVGLRLETRLREMERRHAIERAKQSIKDDMAGMADKVRK